MSLFSLFTVSSCQCRLDNGGPTKTFIRFVTVPPVWGNDWMLTTLCFVLRSGSFALWARPRGGGMARPMPGPRSEERHGQTPANRQMLSRATVLKLGLPLLRRGRRTLSMRKYSYLVQSKAENRRQNIIGLRKRWLLVRLERLFRRAFCGY
jgi:hypothetical protein